MNHSVVKKLLNTKIYNKYKNESISYHFITGGCHKCKMPS